MSTIQYLPDNSPIKIVPVKMRHIGYGVTVYPGQGDDGYGRKITTDKKVQFEGKWYRVYATCFSNAASHWIKVGSQTYHLRG